MHPNLIATLRQVAALTRLDEHEILWAVEMFGYCSTDAYEAFPIDRDGDHFIVRPVPR